MAKPKVAIRIGHHGPGTGAAYNGRDEVRLADTYGNAIRLALISTGYPVLWLPSTSRSYNNDFRDTVNPDPAIGLYIQCHVNSAAGMTVSKDHGIVFHDYRSKRGPGLAQAMVTALSTGYPWRVESDNPTGPYPRVHPCIAGARPVALLLEPWFIQCDRDPVAIGAAIGAALVTALDAGALSGQ